jgi:predicted ribosome quality control (RQC) complex YloA/Tae2 family protein
MIIFLKKIFNKFYRNTIMSCAIAQDEEKGLVNPVENLRRLLQYQGEKIETLTDENKTLTWWVENLTERLENLQMENKKFRSLVFYTDAYIKELALVNVKLTKRLQNESKEQKLNCNVTPVTVTPVTVTPVTVTQVTVAPVNAVYVTATPVKAVYVTVTPVKAVYGTVTPVNAVYETVTPMTF